ncbi:enoyl-CoA hydratase/isomerase family protein [Mycobacterium sp. CVI_P3]|uniref:Enoyl-CoA hydratase/isomerase family protein n=1 Tax=Mycobacterium pinniadriaticum TaxID=2994102 RepID=A0ABT3SF68_9MYCO|nr:enoyl-CoA hydratase/isomerase family protein [Mycobacterium pinniadriaticum]MCX2931763.1 enoyl-CoA hydratase/isomerase family protein [Mycobacterium pinniadriaticum]MCX2938162.1 enoyl-CoA hydratase/isomerase family protein [Mycobacterium pinniadriaticum]
MAEFETLRYEERGAVAWVTLDRPGVLNAVNTTMQRELKEVWRTLRNTDTVRCVVLTGSGERAFTTGRDRSEALDVTQNLAARAPSRRAGFGSTDFHFDGNDDQIGPKSADLWIPVVAAVNGMACGGAFFLLGEADIIIASENATFFDPHVSSGLTAMYESVHMAHRMPFGEISRMALMGSHERLSARRAYEIGLVSEVLPLGDLAAQAKWIAESIASQPTLPLQATVRSLWMARELTRQQALDMGWAMIALGNQPQAREEGLRAFASGKRIPWRLR